MSTGGLKRFAYSWDYRRSLVCGAVLMPRALRTISKDLQSSLYGSGATEQSRKRGLGRIFNYMAES